MHHSLSKEQLRDRVNDARDKLHTLRRSLRAARAAGKQEAVETILREMNRVDAEKQRCLSQLDQLVDRA